MSIPLVQNNEKDSINTSIIAIKKNLERINSFLGLADSSEPDLSGLATKQELEDAVTEINNTIDEVETSLQPVDTVTSGDMHSVTSNAVSSALGEKILFSHQKIGTYTLNANQTLSFLINDYVPSPLTGYERFTTIYVEGQNYAQTSVNFYGADIYATITNCYTSALTYNLYTFVMYFKVA